VPSFVNKLVLLLLSDLCFYGRRSKIPCLITSRPNAPCLAVVDFLKALGKNLAIGDIASVRRRVVKEQKDERTRENTIVVVGAAAIALLGWVYLL
jgi:hypothetical protein